jgi:hypothetical protein
VFSARKNKNNANPKKYGEENLQGQGGTAGRSDEEGSRSKEY